MNYNLDSMLLQIIGGIISTRSSPITDLSSEEGYSPLIANCTLPSFSLIETHQRKDFLKHCISPTNYFDEYPISLSYSEENISFLISNEYTISPKLSSFYNRYILFNFLSWIQTYLNSEKDDDILNLMKSLLIFHEKINLDCFFSLYYICIQKHPVSYFQTMYPLISLVFNEMKDTQLPEYAYSFLPYHFDKLFKDEEKDENDADMENSHFSSNAETMMNFVILLLIDQTSQIPTQVAIEFYDIIKGIAIEKFELRGMTFFANLSGFLPYDTKFEAIVQFPHKIIESIEKVEPYIKLPSSKQPSKTYKLSPSVAAGQFSFSSIESFPDGLGDKANFYSPSLSKPIEDMKIVNFPLVIFNNICDNVLVSLLSFISKSIGDKHNEHDNLLQVFLSKFVSLVDGRKIDQYSFSIIGAFLIFFQINENAKSIIDITPLILKFDVFSPDYNIFVNSDSSFDQINTLRHFSLDFILHQSPEVINSFFENMKKNPLIMAEICERLMNLQNYSLLLKAIIKDKHLFKTICYLTCPFVQNESQGYEKDFDTARYSIFRLLSKLLKEQSLIPQFYNNSLFLAFFFSLLFEIPLQDYVLNEIKMFLVDGCDDTIYDNFIESFSHLFGQSLQCFKISEEGRNLTIKIINSLLEVFEFKSNFAKTFSFIIQPFFDAVESINIENEEKKKEKTFEYLKIIFDYFEFLKNEDISMDTIAFIKDLIMSKHLVDCDDNLFNLIKEKMVKDNIIIQPLLVHLMVLCFWDKKHKEIVKLFIDYCQINSLNSVALHEAGIDSFIVDELKSSNLVDEEITERLNLLEQISIVISSPIIVQNFISLLKRNTNYLYFLNKLIVINYSIPIAILPFYVVIENEFVIDHPGSFSIAVWLYLESDNDEMSIFRINDDSDILIFIKNTQLFVNNANVFELPVKKWFFLAMSFNNKDKSVTGYIYMNTVKVIKEDKPDNSTLMIDWDNLHLKKYRIGDPDSITGRYGNFGFFPELTKLNIRYFVESGPRNLSEPNFPSFEYFTPQKISDIRAAFLKTAEVSNFAEIFLQICKIELILPLFAQLNEDKYLLNQIFLVLRNSLLIDESQQNYFQEIHGFGVITHLLISTNFKGLTFDFYMKFYNLCGEIANINLRNDLIKDVLINFELWSRSSELLQITNHWKTILFAGFEFISSSLIPFKTLLALLRIYLFYTPVETKWIRSEPIVQIDKIAEIRSNIIEILLNQYSSSLETYDYALLMYNLIDCKDHLQVHDLLLFFTHLAESPSPALVEFLGKTEMTLTLHILLVSNDQLIVPIALSLIRLFQRSHLFKTFSLCDMMYIYFQQLKYSEISIPILNRMIGLIQNDLPELFPICCYFGLKLQLETPSSNIFNSIFDNIEPSRSLDTSNIWAIWAIYGAISLNNENILSFLAQCGDSKWIYLYALIDRICTVCEFDGESWKQKFLTIVAEIIESRDPESLKNQSQQIQQQQPLGQRFKLYPFIDNFLDLVAFFIFFRKRQIHNLALIKSYKEEYKDDAILDTNVPLNEIASSKSNYVDLWFELLSEEYFLVSPPCKNDEDKKTIKIEKIKDDAEALILDSSFIDERYTFGIRLSEDATWLDKELASRTARIMGQYSVKNHNELFTLLGQFINNSDLHITESFVESILKRSLISYPYDLYRDIREKIDNTYRKSKKFFSFTPDPLENYGNNRLEETKQSILDNIDISTRNWRILWSHMTIDHAPWDISSGVNVKHYQRDFSLNSFLCPWKTKINRKFDIHENASKMRDSGNFEEEKPKVRPTNLHPLSIIEDEMISKNKETLIVNDNDFIFSHECDVIKISKIINTTFSINSKYIKVLDKTYEMDEIKYVFWRRLKQYPTAIEIFFINGKTLFLNFPGLKGKAVTRQIASFSPKNAIYIQQTDFDVFFQQTKLTEKWQNREISNFEYLMNLNIFGGRSFNDPSQYPFLPWILTNYRDELLDLNDPNNYRDLSKPVGALGEERLKELIQRLSDLKYFNLTEFLYSSYASTPLSVFLFNVRVEPYTSQHILMQGGRFDTPLRQFFSIERTFESVITQMNDYRELPPEFFYDNEFLINLNNFDLGEVLVTEDEELSNLASSNEEFSSTNIGKETNEIETPKAETNEIETPKVETNESETPKTETNESEKQNKETNESNETESNSNYRKVPHKSFSRGCLSNLSSNSHSHSISNVELPPWSNDSAITFIYLNRKALESEFVSSTLHKWIDLVFGINQKGQGALENNNLYKEEMYDDIWEKSRDCDDVRRIEIETIIEQVGQIPPQLFKTEHPMRSSPKSQTNYFIKNRWDLKETVSKTINSGILFSTVHLINERIIQLKMITSLHQVETIDIEYCHGNSAQENKIKVNFISRNDLPAEVSQDDISLFIEVDKNIVLFLANSSLDAFIFNLDTLRAQKINERRQKITTASSAKAQKFSKRHKLNMFSLSFDDSRTNIYYEDKNSKPIKNTQRSSSIKQQDSNASIILNDESSLYNRRSRRKIEKVSSSRVFANRSNIADNSIMNISNSSSNFKLNGENDKKVEKSSSFSIITNLWNNLINENSQQQNSNLFNSNKNVLAENDENNNNLSLLNPSGRPAGYHAIIQRDRLYSLKCSIPTYRKAILCSALSVTFGVSISGTEDGSLIVASIHDGYAIRSIKLDDQRIPIFIHITPAWGFILVNSSKYVNGRHKFFLSLYTINGDEISTIPVDFAIERALSWSNQEGFDYIALMTKTRNKIIAFEAFFLNNVNDMKNSVFKTDQKIASFDYSKKIGAFFVVTIAGSLAIVPYTPQI